MSKHQELGLVAQRKRFNQARIKSLEEAAAPPHGHTAGAGRRWLSGRPQSFAEITSTGEVSHFSDLQVQDNR